MAFILRYLRFNVKVQFTRGKRFFFFLLSSSLGIKNDPKLPIYFYFFWLKTSRGCWFSLVEDLCGFINDLTSLVINYGRQEGCSFSQLKQCGSVSRYNSPR